MAQPRTLVLASASPRRRELLAEAGHRFEVAVPDGDVESPRRPLETPAEYVVRQAQAKAAAVAGRFPSAIVLACDTVAECLGEILGKPADEADARRILEFLSGQEHRVFSGLCLTVQGRSMVAVDETLLRMDRLSLEQLDEYLASGQWRGKAGAFGYQDRLGWVHIVSGSESNVVGLPMELLERMLSDLSASGDCR